MRARILLLEDDGAFALDVKRALVPLGCDVTIVAEGNAGLARAVSDRFDLIIVCAELRGMNGFRVCNRLKKDPAAKPTPLLLMWADASASALDEHMLLPTRADCYVRKPFSPSDLRGQVRAFVPAVATMGSLEMPAVTLRPDMGSEARQRTVSGLVPIPSGTAIPSRPQPVALADLQRELATAQAEQGAMASLRARLTTLEEDNARLVREVQAARVRPTSSSAGPPPLPARADAATSAMARELTAMRERLVRRDKELVARRGELEIATHAIEVKEQALATERKKTAAAEADRNRLAQAEARLAALEKASGALRGERDLALQRAEQAAQRGKQAVDEIDTVRGALKAETQARLADADQHAREAARRESERTALASQHAAELVAIAAQHAEANARATFQLRQEAERVRSEAAEKLARVGSETEAAIAERDARLEKELATLRLERDAALAQLRETADARLRASDEARNRRVAELELGLEQARAEAEQERAARTALSVAHAEELGALERLRDDERSDAELRHIEDERLHAARLATLSVEHEGTSAELQRIRAELETAAKALATATAERESGVARTEERSRRVAALERALAASEAAREVAHEDAHQAARQAAEENAATTARIAALDHQIAELSDQLTSARAGAETHAEQLTTRTGALAKERDDAVTAAAQLSEQVRMLGDELLVQEEAGRAAEVRAANLADRTRTLDVEVNELREVRRANDERTAALTIELAEARATQQRLERANAERDTRHASEVAQLRSEAERSAEALRTVADTERSMREHARVDLDAAYAERTQLWAERAELRSALGAEEEARAGMAVELERATLAARTADGAAQDERTKLVADYEARVAAREEALDVARRMHEEAIGALEREKTTERTDWATKLRAEQSRHAELSAAADAAHAAAAAELQTERDLALTTAERRFAAERTHLENEHRAALSALERTLTVSAEAGAEDVRRAQTDLATREAMLAEVGRERDALIVAAREHEATTTLLDATISNLRAQVTSERHARGIESAEIATAHASALAEQTALRESERAELDRKHLAALDQLKREQAAANVARAAEQEDALASLRSRHTDELAVARQHGAEQAGRANALRRAAETAHAEELSKREANHRNALRELGAAGAESRAAAEEAAARLEERAREIAVLEQSLATQATDGAERVELIAARDTAIRERDEAQAARAKALEERDAASAAREIAERAQKEANERRDAAVAEGERATSERDRQLAERELALQDAANAARAATERETELRTAREADAQAHAAELARRTSENEAAISGLEQLISAVRKELHDAAQLAKTAAAAEAAAREELDWTKAAIDSAEARAATLETRLAKADEAAQDDRKRALESSAASGRAYADLVTARDVVRADLERRLVEQQKAHANVVATRDSAQASTEARLVSERSEKLALHSELASTRTAAAAAATQARTESDSLNAVIAELRERVDEQSAAMERERRRGASAEAQHEAKLADAERARFTLEAELRAEVAHAASARDASLAARDEEAARTATKHAVALEALRQETSRQIAELVREHDAALTLARSTERDGATARAATLLEQRIADVTSQLRDEAEAAETARRVTREAELREWTAQREAEQQTLASRIGDLETLVARGREALDEERRDRLREEFETMRQADELEAQVEAGKEQLAALERELTTVRDEVPALEDEIAALRAELTSVRSSMDSESTLLRVANAQLDGNRRLLDRAKEALAELVAESEKAAGG